ncbi:MAG TPA: IPT/TIG domain-containing protein [Candidatus Acidoferrum sp.]|nr:IPT/TIG domain-containing protein [Candidatus Acidoferrum sp.]
MRRHLALSSLLILSLVAQPWLATGQSPAIQYAYDELGRLVAVVDHQGNAAIYAYDSVGNILSIQRFDAATLSGVAITALVPDKGKAGTVVSILGKGFGGAGQNGVAFNGVAASVAQSSANRLVASVPAGATTGPITVTAPLGSATSPRPFRIVGALAVTPLTATLGTGATQPFVAREDGVDTSNVLWSVDGVVGGDAGVGTISAQGLYVAPTVIPSLRAVGITATNRDDASVAASAIVTLRPPAPAFLAAAPLGVQVAEPGLRTLVSSAVGIQRAPDADGTTIVAAAIGVGPADREAFAAAAPVSVNREPLITAVSPSAAARGSTNLTLTVTGSGLAGAAGLEFLLNNTVDAAVTVANTTVAPDGTQITAQIAIAAGAVVGPRVVRASGPAGSTTPVGAGGNVLTVQ